MSDFSNNSESIVFTWLLRSGTAAPTRPAAQYVALFTAVTDAEAGTGTEVSGGGYARQAVTMGAPSNGVGTNSGELLFTASGAAFGTITHACIMDASTAGNALTTIKALTASKVINDGDTLRFAAGTISVTIA